MLLRTVWLEARSVDDIAADETAAGARAQDALLDARQVLREVMRYRDEDIAQRPNAHNGVSLWCRVHWEHLEPTWYEAFRVSWEKFEEKALLRADWTMHGDATFNGDWVASL